VKLSGKDERQSQPKTECDTKKERVKPLNEILTEEEIQEQYAELQQLLRIMKKWKVVSVEWQPKSNGVKSDDVKMVFEETSPTSSTFQASTFFGIHPDE
jgi:hypothetical protein